MLRKASEVVYLVADRAAAADVWDLVLRIDRRGRAIYPDAIL